jgi:uncharacterized membrane protein
MRAIVASQQQRLAVCLFSVGMIGLGMLSVLARDFAFDWQPLRAFHPGRDALVVGCGLFLIAASVGLLIRATAAIAARVLFPFLVLWLCLKVPAVVAAPAVEGVWSGLGEIGMLLAGGWILFARLSLLESAPFLRHITATQGVRRAQFLFGLSVLPVGLAHFFYNEITASLVPSWLPFRSSVAYMTGPAQLACGFALLFSIVPRAAALIEAVMVGLFAFLVWGPAIWVSTTPTLAGAPSGGRFPLPAFLITWGIGAPALLIATGGRANRMEGFNAGPDRGTKSDDAGFEEQATQ